MRRLGLLGAGSFGRTGGETGASWMASFGGGGVVGWGRSGGITSGCGGSVASGLGGGVSALGGSGVGFGGGAVSGLGGGVGVGCGGDVGSSEARRSGGGGGGEGVAWRRGFGVLLAIGDLVEFAHRDSFNRNGFRGVGEFRRGGEAEQEQGEQPPMQRCGAREIRI